jgi:integrase
MPALHPHDLRHSYAVAALRSGIDVKTVQNNLGHRYAAMTLDTYAAYTTDAGKVGAELFSAYWKNALKCP